jgi:hypothetical protein
MAMAWRDPIITGRLLRGIRLTMNMDGHVQQARKNMQQNWHKSEFREIMKNRPRRFTAAQIRAIRADSRVSRLVSREYGVTHQIISKIRAKTIYADIE